MKLVIDGDPVELHKAAESHIEGKECLFVGTAEDGSVKLMESDDPSRTLSTSARNLRVFAQAVVNGEFNLEN